MSLLGISALKLHTWTQKLRTTRAPAVHFCVAIKLTQPEMLGEDTEAFLGYSIIHAFHVLVIYWLLSP